VTVQHPNGTPDKAQPARRSSRSCATSSSSGAAPACASPPSSGSEGNGLVVGQGVRELDRLRLRRARHGEAARPARARASSLTAILVTRARRSHRGRSCVRRPYDIAFGHLRHAVRGLRAPEGMRHVGFDSHDRALGDLEIAPTPFRTMRASPCSTSSATARAGSGC
jgi:hypothetical protein